MRYRIAIPAAVLFAVLAGPASAQRAADPDQEACMNDAFQFCSAEIPDEHRVFLCLKAHRRDLTPACRALVSGSKPASRRKPDDRR